MKVRHLFLSVLMITVASAESNYSIALTAPTHVGEKDLQPGKYKVSVEGGKALFKSGKTVVAEVPASIEKGNLKFAETGLSISNSSLQSILVGGTNLTIVLKAK